MSSSRRQVGMFAAASAPSTRNSSRSGAASASSVSAVTDGAVAVDLDPRHRQPGSTRPRARSSGRGPPPTPRPGPRFCHGSPAGRAAPRRARARHARRPRRRGDRGARDRRCHRGHRDASPRRFYGRLPDGSVSSARCARARSASVGCAREPLPRVDPGPRPRPPGRARPRRVAHRRGEGRHRRHRDASTGTTAPRSTSSPVILPDADLVPTVEREIAEVDGAEVAGVDDRRRVPRAPARRDRVRAGD